MNHYVVVFDVTKNGYQGYWFPAFGLIFVVYGVGELLCRRYFLRIFRRRFRRLTLIFPIAWVCLTLVATYGDYSRLSSRLQEGRCTVTEGPVMAFRPARNKNEGESFVVGGQYFTYSPHAITAGFNQTQAEGGPIRADLQIRIYHLRGEIARLEVAE